MTTDSGSSVWQIQSSEFFCTKFTRRFDGDIVGIKQGISRHLHSFYCGGRPSRIEKIKREAIPFAVLQISKTIGFLEI